MCGHREHAYSLFEIRRVADRGPPDKNSHPESLASRDAQSKRSPSFRRPDQVWIERILLIAQTLLYQTYTITIFEIEGRWSTHGNEESSEEACKEGPGQEEEVVAP